MRNNILYLSSKRGIKHNDLFIILIVGIIISVIIIISNNIVWHSDSLSYVNASASLMHGILDESRPPVYPLIICLSKLIYNVNFTIPLRIIQFSIFIISIIYYYRIIFNWTTNYKLSMWGSYIYLIYGISWCNYILTESLSLSFLTILAYYTKEWLSFYTKRSLFSLMLILNILIFLKPIFIYLIPIYVCWFLFVFLKRKLKFSKALFTILLLGITVFNVGTYVYAFNSQHGIIATSHVGIFNQYHILGDNKLLSLPGNIDYSKRDQRWEAINREYIKHNFPENQELVNKIIKNNKKIYFYALGERFYRSSFDYEWNNTLALQIPILSTFINFFLSFVFRLNFVYFIVLVYTFLFFRNSIKYKYISIFGLFLYFCIIGNILSMIIGAPDDFGRLFVPSYPFVILLILKLVNGFSNKLTFNE